MKEGTRSKREAEREEERERARKSENGKM